MTQNNPNSRRPWPLQPGRLLPRAEADARSRQPLITDENPTPPPPDPTGGCNLAWSDCTTNALISGYFGPATTLADCRLIRAGNPEAYGAMAWFPDTAGADIYEGSSNCLDNNLIYYQAATVDSATIWLKAQTIASNVRGTNSYLSTTAEPAAGPADPIFVWTALHLLDGGYWDADFTLELTADPGSGNWTLYSFAGNIAAQTYVNVIQLAGPIAIPAPDA